jgi:two-component system CheB/CheR fusion protein
MVVVDLLELQTTLRIFVVENHPDTLFWLKEYLGQMGHVVTSARTKAEAMEALPTAECDVLISDIGLPDGDGWELLRTVRLPRPIYGIAMSGFGMRADRAKSEAAGYRHHILKPFDPAVLDGILAEAAREVGRK